MRLVNDAGSEDEPSLPGKRVPKDLQGASLLVCSSQPEHIEEPI